MLLWQLLYFETESNGGYGLALQVINSFLYFWILLLYRSSILYCGQIASLALRKYDRKFSICFHEWYHVSHIARSWLRYNFYGPTRRISIWFCPNSFPPLALSSPQYQMGHCKRLCGEVVAALIDAPFFFPSVPQHDNNFSSPLRKYCPSLIMSLLRKSKWRSHNVVYRNVCI